jgi:hypothetical protein
LFTNEDYDEKYNFLSVFNDDFLSDICVKSSFGRDVNITHF